MANKVTNNTVGSTIKKRTHTSVTEKCFLVPRRGRPCLLNPRPGQFEAFCTLKLTSSTLTRKLTSYLIFEVFGGCPRVSKRIHNCIFRPVRHKPWAQAAMNVLIVTLESGHQSVDRTLAKKVTLHGQPHQYE